jgi:hypothetical protein
MASRAQSGEYRLTLADVVEQIDVPGIEDAIRTAVSGKCLEGWYRLTDDGVRFRPDTVQFMKWASRLADAMADGHVGYEEAVETFRRQSARRSSGSSNTPQ